MSIQQSIEKGKQAIATLKHAVPSVEHHHGKYSHLDYLLTIPSTGFNSGALTSQQTINFEIKNSPAYFLKDNRSLILYVKVSETGGAASVKPMFAEAFFEKGGSFEWLVNNQQITTPSPMMQTVLEPAIELANNEYKLLVPSAQPQQHPDVHFSCLLEEFFYA